MMIDDDESLTRWSPYQEGSCPAAFMLTFSFPPELCYIVESCSFPHGCSGTLGRMIFDSI
jgi:hypothetical protein